MSLEATGITVAFDGPPVLDRFSISVGTHEIVAIQGPSGCGKSTLLRVIAGILIPDAGRVILDGSDITDLAAHRRRIAMVFQDNLLFPHRDVAGNIAFGPQMRGDDAQQRHRIVTELLELVGLSGYGHRRVDELSGGEAKRVAVARALAARPRVLLLDEPLTGLDTELHDRLAGDLVEILRSSSTAALWVTHDRHEAEAFTDRIVQMATPH